MLTIKFVEVTKPTAFTGETLFEIQKYMYTDLAPHIPAVGETIVPPGEPTSARRVVCGVHKRYKKRPPEFSVIVTVMPLKAWNAAQKA